MFSPSVHNGDATKRSEVYNNLYRKMQKKDRLVSRVHP
ncbi:MAG: DUF3879 family protein [Anaerobutyricum sp.]